MRATGLPASTKVILMYLTVTYGVPGALMAGFGMWPDYYNAASPHPLAIAGTALSIGLVLLVIGRRGMAPRRHAGGIVPLRWMSEGLQTVLLTALALLALVAFAGDGSRWRYSEEGLSDAGSPLLYVYSMIPLVLRAFVLAYVMLDPRFGTRPADTLRKAMVIAGLFLSVNGNVTMLLAFMGTLALVLLHGARRVFWVPLDGSGQHAGLLRQFALPLALVPMLALAWLLGETVKRDQPIETVLKWLFDRDVATWLVEMMVGRSSPSYVSAVVALDRFAFNLDWGVLGDHLAAPVSSFLFRLGQLLPIDLLSVPRPQDGSIMRINYLMITPLPFNDREGTSPGLVAGFIYSFPFPLNFAALSLYLLFVAWVIDGLARAIPGRLTALGTLALMIFVLPLFESPIDFLLVVDDGTIYLGLLLALRWCCSHGRQDSRPSPHGVLAPGGFS